MTKKTFTYEFEQEPNNSITFDYGPEGDEKLTAAVHNGMPFLYLNRPGLLALAKLLIKMAEGDYDEQFHVHLRKDFGDGPEILTVMLYPDDTKADPT